MTRKLNYRILILITILVLNLGLVVRAEDSRIVKDRDLNFKSLNDYYESLNEIIYGHLAKEYEIDLDLDILKDFASDYDENQARPNKYQLYKNDQVIKAFIGEEAYYNKFMPDYVTLKLLEAKDNDFQEFLEVFQEVFEQVNREILEIKAPDLVEEK